MNLLDRLDSVSPWERGLALFTLETADAADPAVLARVLLALEDDEPIQPPPAVSTQDEKAFVEWLSGFGVEAGLPDPIGGIEVDVPVLDVEPDLVEPVSEEFAIETITHLVRDVAELASDRIAEGPLSASGGTLEALASVLGRDRSLRAAWWIDRNFFAFPWTDPSAAFRRFAEAVLAREDRFEMPAESLHRAGQADRLWLAGRLGSMAAPDGDLLERLLRACPEGEQDAAASAFLDAANSEPFEGGGDLLEPLAKFLRRPALRGRALALLRSIETAGAAPAAGYAALADAADRKRFADMLATRSRWDLDEWKLLRNLLRRVLDQGAPPAFPVAELALALGPKDALENLETILETLDPGEQGDFLRKLAMQAREAGMPGAFRAWWKLAEGGALLDDAEGARSLWAAASSDLPDYTVPGKLDPEPGPFRNRIETTVAEPLRALSKPSVRPPGFEEAILDLLEKRKLPASFSPEFLSGWSLDARGRDILSGAVRAELHWIRSHREGGGGAWQGEPDASKPRWKALHDLLRSAGLSDVAGEIR